MSDGESHVEQPVRPSEKPTSGDGEVGRLQGIGDRSRKSTDA